MSSIRLERDVQGLIFDFSDCLSVFHIIAVALRRGYAASHQSAAGRGCVKTPQQSHPRSHLQTQRETLLTGLRTDSVLLASN